MIPFSIACSSVLGMIPQRRCRFKDRLRPPLCRMAHSGNQSLRVTPVIAMDDAPPTGLLAMIM